MLKVIKKSKDFFPCFLFVSCPYSYVFLYPGSHKEFYYSAAWGPGLERRKTLMSVIYIQYLFHSESEHAGLSLE